MFKLPVAPEFRSEETAFPHAALLLKSTAVKSNKVFLNLGIVAALLELGYFIRLQPAG